MKPRYLMSCPTCGKRTWWSETLSYGLAWRRVQCSSCAGFQEGEIGLEDDDSKYSVLDYGYDRNEHDSLTEWERTHELDAEAGGYIG